MADDTSVDNREEAEASYNTTTSTEQGESNEDAEDEIFELDRTGASSKNRKRIGVWNAVKRFFSGISSKADDSRSPNGKPQRSVSDPNLAHRTGERPDLAPLEQVHETPMETEVSPKKAMSRDSLLSELRSKKRKNVDGEKLTSPKPSDVDWQMSASPTARQLLPDLNVSQYKIRVAPRHRSAPTRMGVATSVRHGGSDITDVLYVEITNTADVKHEQGNSQTASDSAVSSLMTVEDAKSEVMIVELISEPSEETRSVSQSVKLPAVDEKIREVNRGVPVEENFPPLSPSPTTSSATARSKRLVIETPGKVYKKPIVAERTPSAPPVTNGSVKMLSIAQAQTGESKDTQADLPSFRARRSIFSPEQKTKHSTPPQDTQKKPKDVTKLTPFIQIKTDTCDVCGSKVYQMEKFEVKDNIIVHRSCIKCSVCKRLLTVGNFIMSQNKIYCKPHEPHLPIHLTTF